MRCALQILFYPTAIGSEPQDPSLNSYPHWTRVMCGHAGANLVRRTQCMHGLLLLATHAQTWAAAC